MGCVRRARRRLQHDAIGASYPTFTALVAYCRLVAGSVGRLSLAVFGTTNGQAPELADALGVALQLTNILRDIVEDREMGRTYLPSDDIARFGADPELTGPADSVAALVAFEAVRAREWFDEGLSCSPCSTTGAGRASVRWRASTAGC